MSFFSASGEISLTNEPAEEPSSVIRKRRRTSPDSDLDDFELISGDELAEVSPWIYVASYIIMLRPYKRILKRHQIKRF